MNLEITNQSITWIVGKKKSGKSNFLKWVLQYLDSYVIWDYNHEHTGMGILTYTLEEIPRLISKPPYKVVYHPQIKDEAELNQFCRIVFTRLQNTIVVIEEVEHYATAHYCPKQLQLLINSGRHDNLGLIFTSRRPRRIWGDIPYNRDYLVIFRVTYKNDLNYLADEVGSEEIKKIRYAPDYHFFVDTHKELYFFPPVQNMTDVDRADVSQIEQKKPEYDEDVSDET